MIEWCSAAGVSIGVDLGDRQGGMRRRGEGLCFWSLERFRDEEGEGAASERGGVGRWRD